METVTAGRAVVDISDESSYVSGTKIPVDGGLSSHGGTKSMSDAVRAMVS